MRVNNLTPQFGIQPGKVKRPGESDEVFELPEETSRADAKTGAKPASASSLGALIAAQLHGIEEEEIEERRRKRQRGVHRGLNILDTLDEIKLEMLAGRLSPNQILKLLGSLDAREPDSGDPKLNGILDEIELRARVELAKLQRKQGDS